MQHAGSNYVVCTALDQCHVAGVCIPATGLCTNPIATNGTTCDDGQLCTYGDVCTNGTCGGTAITCTDDQCNTRACNGTNACTVTPVTDGTTCNDGDACSQTDTCQTGVCTGSNYVVCTALDQCHVAGTCNPANGQCSNPPAGSGTACGNQTATQCDNPDTCDGAGHCMPNYVANGTGCDDGFGCTVGDACNGAGLCAGVVKDCSDGNACTLDTCIEPSGTCDHSQSSGACNIVGHVTYYRAGAVEPSTNPISGETVQRTSDVRPPASSVTDASGMFSFPNEYSNITLTPQLLASTNEGGCRAAITAADATEIAKGAISMVVLTNNQKIAADVSYNGRITSYDAALTAQKAVASTCLGYTFPAKTATGSDWAFVPVSKSFTPLAGGENYDFVGVFYGDVTGNWSGPAAFAAAAAGTGTSGGEVGQPTTGVGRITPKPTGTGAVLGMVGAPTQNKDGSWTVVFSLQHSNGILGLDLGFTYNPALVQIRNVVTTGIGSNLTVLTNENNEGVQFALYTTTALQGNGAFLQVTYTAVNPGAALPFQVAAQANEGQIPLTWAPNDALGLRPSRCISRSSRIFPRPTPDGRGNPSRPGVS